MRRQNRKFKKTETSIPCEPLAKAFAIRLKELCAKLGFTLKERGDGTPQFLIYFAPDFPMWVRIHFDPDARSAWLFGIVRTHGLAGDRSDYHDLISLLWSGYLRSRNDASVRLIDIPHPVISGELWGRYIFFEKQPLIVHLA